MILGKAFWGRKGKSLIAVERCQQILEGIAGVQATEVSSDYYTRSYKRQLEVAGTMVTFSYNSSCPGYGTISWKGQNSAIAKVISVVMTELLAG